MKYCIIFDPERCSACGACSVACMDQNDVDLAGGGARLRWVQEYENPHGAHGNCTYLSISCHHCGDAPCVIACPTGCLSKDGASGMTVYDREKCIGCHSCALACPYGVPQFALLDGKLVKCDGCHIRMEHGLSPACVRACPFGALLCLAQEELAAWGKDRTDYAILQEINAI